MSRISSLQVVGVLPKLKASHSAIKSKQILRTGCVHSRISKEKQRQCWFGRGRRDGL